MQSERKEPTTIMDIDTYNILNPPFEFDEDALTPRKREILAWIKANQIELRSLDPRDPRNMRALRVYIPLELSRPNMTGPFHVLRPALSGPLLELFDDEFKLEYVESYPSADKYCFTTIQGKSNAEVGAAIYNRLVLSVYDLYVLGFSNSYVWQCPSSQILEFYNKHISSQHLDIGVGTGYFLDRCKFPTNNPRLALADLNPNSLRVAAKRLQRYRPMRYFANVLEPLRIEPAGFDSVAINNLLHCLPGKMLDKGIVFRNIKPLLSADGKVFGVTVLGKGIRPNVLAKFHLRLYNSKGIFGNRDDSREDLERILKETFSDYEIRQVGCVAMFIGQI